MARPKPISGFPEFLPAGRLVENQVLGAITSTFELHGFAPIETRAVEPLGQLARKERSTRRYTSSGACMLKPGRPTSLAFTSI